MNKKDVRMIDVTAKKETERLAIASARINVSAETLQDIKKLQVPKGDVLTVAQTAGIMAAKNTPNLLPLCHPLLLTSTSIDFKLHVKGSYIEITATVVGTGKTGFEMEALTAVSVAALTVYDMCKMLDKGMTITDIRLLKKMGGNSGTYTAK
jgi:cyclic pyranopterin monophosphate synthase